MSECERRRAACHEVVTNGDGVDALPKFPVAELESVGLKANHDNMDLARGVGAEGGSGAGRPVVDSNRGFPLDKMSLAELKAHVETRLKSGIRFSHIAAGLRVHRNTLRRYMMKDASWGGVYDKSPLTDVLDQLREVVPLEDNGSCWGIRKCQAALRATNHRVSRRKVRAALNSLDSAALQSRRVKRKDDSSHCEGGSETLDEGRSNSCTAPETGATESLCTLEFDAQRHFLREEQESGRARNGDQGALCSILAVVPVGGTGFGPGDVTQPVDHAQGIVDSRITVSCSGNDGRESICTSTLPENDLPSGINRGLSRTVAPVRSALFRDDGGADEAMLLSGTCERHTEGAVGSDPQGRQEACLNPRCSEQSGNKDVGFLGGSGNASLLFPPSVGDVVCMSAGCGYTDAPILRCGRSSINLNSRACGLVDAGIQGDDASASKEVGPRNAGNGAGTVRKGWFPYADEFKLNEEEGSLTSKAILEKLDSFLVAGRRKRIESVVGNRTYTICIVLEGLLDPSHVSSVFKSADAFGIQSVHMISSCQKNRSKKLRKSVDNVEKWLDVETWDSIRECITTLRTRGYRIAVTHVAADSISIHDMDWSIPTAVILGNESRGPSHEAILSSDIRCSIPMVGMEDALSVSVIAGIVMQHSVRSRLTKFGVQGDLMQREQQILAAEFCMRHGR